MLRWLEYCRPLALVGEKLQLNLNAGRYETALNVTVHERIYVLNSHDGAFNPF